MTIIFVAGGVEEFEENSGVIDLGFRVLENEANVLWPDTDFPADVRVQEGDLVVSPVADAQGANKDVRNVDDARELPIVRRFFGV